MPSTTQLRPNRNVLCRFDDSTGSRKKPPKATLAPRLWQSVSSTTSQAMPPGTGWVRTNAARTIPRSSHSQAGGGMEDGIGGVVMPLGGQSGGLPDLGDGAGPEANDPAGDQRVDGGEDAGVAGVAERLYQGGQSGNKLAPGAGLRWALAPGQCGNPQDTESVREGPLFDHR